MLGIWACGGNYIVEWQIIGFENGKYVLEKFERMKLHTKFDR